MANIPTLKTILTSAVVLLNNDEATFETQLLLRHVLNVNRAWLIAHENDVLAQDQYLGFQTLLQRRLNGEPIAYILGYREFYGLNLKVTADTLIPRPDTETLVEAALAKIPQTRMPPIPSFRRKPESSSNALCSKSTVDSGFRRNDEVEDKNFALPTFAPMQLNSHLRVNDELNSIAENNPPLQILDLGTGSGAIALAIAKHCPFAHVTANDASKNALEIARENAKNLQITNINFILSDWFYSLNEQKFDVIVSNPPYIETDDPHLTQGDLRFEPLSALASGADGLKDMRRIIADAPAYLQAGGWLMLEHGYQQAPQITQLLNSAGFCEIGTVRDLGGNERVTFGRKR